MSTDPERHIEKQLNSFANQRRGRAGAPFKMHNATRNLLQSQVARRTLKSRRKSNLLSQMFAGLRPRIAFGVSVLAVMMFCTWIFFQTQKKPDESLKAAATFPAIQSVGENAAGAAAAPEPADAKKTESANLPSEEVDLNTSTTLARAETATAPLPADRLGLAIQPRASAPPAGQPFYDAQKVDRSTIGGLSGAGVNQRFKQMAT